MCLNSYRRSLVIWLLFCLSLLPLLAGCAAKSTQTGAAPSSCAPPGIAAPTMTPGTNPSPPSLTQLFNSSAAVDMKCGGSQLHIQTGGLDCGAWVVLNNVRPTYDIGSINEMENYLQEFGGATGSGAFPYTHDIASKIPPIPDTLQVVPGDMGCGDRVDITNTSAQSVEIQSLGATFTKQAVQNTFAYNLIDTCTLQGVSTFCCTQDCGAGGQCDYYAPIDLHAAPVGTHINGSVKSDEADLCPLPLVVKPNQLVEITLGIDSTPTNLIYEGVELTLEVSSGKGTSTILTLPSSFTSTLVFADHQQFSCYGFNGTTFTAEAVWHQGVGNAIGCM